MLGERRRSEIERRTTDGDKSANQQDVDSRESSRDPNKEKRDGASQQVRQDTEGRATESIDASGKDIDGDAERSLGRETRSSNG